MTLTKRQKRKQISSDIKRTNRISKYSFGGLILYCPVVYFFSLFSGNLEIQYNPWLLIVYTLGISTLIWFLYDQLLQFLLHDRNKNTKIFFHWDFLAGFILFASIPNYFLICALNERVSFEGDFKSVDVHQKTFIEGKHPTCHVDVMIDSNRVKLLMRSTFCQAKENQLLVRKGILGLYAVRR